MKPLLIPSIRSRLAILTILSMAPAFLMASLVLVHDYRQRQAELIEGSVLSARTLSHLIDRELGTAQVSLQVLAVSPSLQTQDYAAFQRQAQEVLKRGFINNVALIDPSGQQVMNTAIPYGQPLPKTGVMDLMRRVVATGQPEVSGVVTGAALKRPLISVMVPVFSGQTVTHAMSGVILPDHFGKMLDSYGLPEDRITVIFDKSESVVARSHEPQLYLGKPVAAGLHERLKQVNEGAFELLSLEGVTVLSAFSRSVSSGWGVAIGIPVSVLTKDLRQSMGILLGVGLLLLGLGVLSAWLLGGRIAGAVRALQKPALELGLGRRIEVPQLGIREVNEVGAALTKASELLRSARGDLSDNEARLRSMVESATDAIIAVDAQQLIVMFNAAATTMFGCPAAQAMGLPLDRFIPERFHSQNAEIFERHRATRVDLGQAAGGVTVVTVGLRMNGEEFPAEVSFSSVLKAGGMLYTLIIRDVTSRVRAYKALERSNLDLQQFAYVASHDLKTPLRSIGGFVQLLERNYGHKLDEKALSLIHRTTAAVARLEQLTEDLLSYARLETQGLQFESVDMAGVAQDVVQMLDDVIRGAGATVTVRELPVVRGDRTQLAQLLMNLVGNGIKYCRDRAPQVELSAVRKDGEWVFSVKDNGIGIDPRHREKVFEVFKRLHSQNEYPGTGIGLAICRRVVESHSGRIWIADHAGPGTTFSFTLSPDLPGPPHEA